MIETRDDFFDLLGDTLSDYRCMESLLEMVRSYLMIPDVDADKVVEVLSLALEKVSGLNETFDSALIDGRRIIDAEGVSA